MRIVFDAPRNQTCARSRKRTCGARERDRVEADRDATRPCGEHMTVARANRGRRGAARENRDMKTVLWGLRRESVDVPLMCRPVRWVYKTDDDTRRSDATMTPPRTRLLALRGSVHGELSPHRFTWYPTRRTLPGPQSRCDARMIVHVRYASRHAADRGYMLPHSWLVLRAYAVARGRDGARRARARV